MGTSTVTLTVQGGGPPADSPLVLFDILDITLADDTLMSSLHWLNFYLHQMPRA